MFDARGRLDRAEARRTLRASLRVNLEQMVMICAAIRQGLRQLGFDPTRAEMLVRYEAQTKADLAALSPCGSGGSQQGGYAADVAHRVGDDFLNLIRHYRDPATWTPDIAEESVLTLWTFVLARAPEAFADLERSVAGVEQGRLQLGRLGLQPLILKVTEF